MVLVGNSRLLPRLQLPRHTQIYLGRYLLAEVIDSVGRRRDGGFQMVGE